MISVVIGPVEKNYIPIDFSHFFSTLKKKFPIFFSLKNDIFLIILETLQKGFEIILEPRKHVLGTQNTL